MRPAGRPREPGAREPGAREPFRLSHASRRVDQPPSAPVRAAFAYFDASGCGLVDHGELRHALRYLGINTHAAEVADLLRPYDERPGGKLDIFAFNRLV